jgi:glycosidase
MYPGIPMLYYGEETGMNGGCDPENRAPMVWDSALWDTGLSRHIRLLSDIRANSPALRIGGYVPMPQPGLPSLLAFARTGADPRETVLMLANASDKHLDARVFAPLSHLFDSLPMRDLLNPDRKTAVSSGTVRVSLTPWEATALVPDDSLTPEYSFFRTMPAS